MGVMLFRAVMRTVKVRRTVDRLVLWVIADHANDETRIGWPSIRTIGDLSGLDRKEVRIAIANLAAAGHIEIRRGEPGRGHPNLYRIILPDPETDLIEGDDTPLEAPQEGGETRSGRGGGFPPFSGKKGGDVPPFSPPEKGGNVPPFPHKGGGTSPPFTRLNNHNHRWKRGGISPEKGGNVPPEPLRTLKEKEARGAEVIDTEEIKRSAIVDYVAGRRPSIPESWLSPERLAALRADGRISDQDQKKLGVMYG